MYRNRKEACKVEGSAAETNLVRRSESSIQLRGQAADLSLQLLLVSVLACQLLNKVLLFGLGISQAGFSAACSAVGLVHIHMQSCNLLHPATCC